MRLVGGKPLITWSLDVGLAAPSISRLVVSTDDHEIADLARSAGVEVPFLRPAEFASDTALAIDVITHALDHLLRADNYRPDVVLWLQPTSPLRTIEDIETSIALMKEKSASSVVSVSPAEHHHPFLMKRLDDHGLLRPWVVDQTLPQRRQELPAAYCLNGAIYLARRELLLEQRTFYSESTYAYVMPAERSLDIDNAWDLYLVDLILKDRNHRARN
jgi:CMP-N-acetylneuraminic acid synthetase